MALIRTNRSPTWALGLCLLPLTACVVGGDKYDRPRDLSPSWLVDRTRILAVRADPPEIAPGETATFEALIPDPGGSEELSRIWFACPPEDDGGIGFGCNLDLGDADFSGTGTDTAPEGFIGFEPFMPPVYTPPLDLLDGLTDDVERSEGLQVVIQITAMPASVLESDNPDVDFNQLEVGYKRLIVSDASTPNGNPVIDEFLVDRMSVLPDTLVHVTAGQMYEPGIILNEDDVEEYEFLLSSGEVEPRREEPWAAWYSSGGEIIEPITLYEYTESTWIAPDKPGETGTWWVVVRDRRGGMTWTHRNWVVDE